MKVKTILAQAANCNSEADAANLLERLESSFEKTSALGQFSSMNSEAYMEHENKPFVRFELNHVISNHYITMIRPEVRDGKFVVVVYTNRMLDGLGMASKSWEVYGDMETVIEAEDDQTIAQLAKLAKDQAIANHAELLETVGVKSEVAKTAAKRSW